jgi:hypothetical protein
MLQGAYFTTNSQQNFRLPPENISKPLIVMEPAVGLEPTTGGLQNR